jgi:hypothetical protein
MRLRVDDVCAGGRVRDRGTVIQKKTGDRSSSKSWSRAGPRSMIGCRRSNSGTGATCSRAVSGPDCTSLPGNTLASFMPGSRLRGSTVRPTAHIQCAGRKAAQIYRKTGNLRAVQLLLGHTKLESTVRYLGIEVDVALSISEQVEL